MRRSKDRSRCDPRVRCRMPFQRSFANQEALSEERSTWLDVEKHTTRTHNRRRNRGRESARGDSTNGNVGQIDGAKELHVVQLRSVRSFFTNVEDARDLLKKRSRHAEVPV